MMNKKYEFDGGGRGGANLNLWKDTVYFSYTTVEQNAHLFIQLLHSMNNII